MEAVAACDKGLRRHLLQGAGCVVDQFRAPAVVKGHSYSARRQVTLDVTGEKYHVSHLHLHMDHGAYLLIKLVSF